MSISGMKQGLKAGSIERHDGNQTMQVFWIEAAASVNIKLSGSYVL
jgi:hypothetical protein